MFSSEIVSHYGITQLPPQAEGEEIEPEDEVIWHDILAARAS
jgi:hypothetical protein